MRNEFMSDHAARDYMTRALLDVDRRPMRTERPAETFIIHHIAGDCGENVGGGRPAGAAAPAGDDGGGGDSDGDGDGDGDGEGECRRRPRSLPTAAQHFDSLPGSAKIDITALRALVGNKSRSTIYRWLEAGILPKPTRIAGGNFWKVSDVRAFLAGNA